MSRLSQCPGRLLELFSLKVSSLLGQQLLWRHRSSSHQQPGHQHHQLSLSLLRQFRRLTQLLQDIVPSIAAEIRLVPTRSVFGSWNVRACDCQLFSRVPSHGRRHAGCHGDRDGSWRDSKARVPFWKAPVGCRRLLLPRNSPKQP